jgi:hypothetical protein
MTLTLPYCILIKWNLDAESDLSLKFTRLYIVYSWFPPTFWSAVFLNNLEPQLSLEGWFADRYIYIVEDSQSLLGGTRFWTQLSTDLIFLKRTTRLNNIKITCYYKIRSWISVCFYLI